MKKFEKDGNIYAILWDPKGDPDIGENLIAFQPLVKNHLLKVLRVCQVCKDGP